MTMTEFKVGNPTASKEPHITSKELQSALLRRQVSVSTFAKGAGISESTVYGYLKKGIPSKYTRSGLRVMLDNCERTIWGGHHVDAFPETLKDTI